MQGFLNHSVMSKFLSSGIFFLLEGFHSTIAHTHSEYCWKTPTQYTENWEHLNNATKEPFQAGWYRVQKNTGNRNTGNKSKSSGQAPVRDQTDTTATHSARDYDPNERREGNQHKTRDAGGVWNKKTKRDPVSWKRDKASGKVPMQLANTLLTGYLISLMFKVYSS